MLKTQKVFWWRTGFANTEGKLGKEPDGEMGSMKNTYQPPFWKKTYEKYK
jgi:hypothetical protein